MKEIDFINAKKYTKKVSYPIFLYKYRPFDNFTFDMLENEYLYLCPAEKLDDPSECTVTMSDQDIFDFMTHRLNFRCIDKILELILPNAKKDVFLQVKNLVYRAVTPDGLVRRDYLLNNYFDIQELVPQIDIAPLVNYLGSIPEQLKEEVIQKDIRKKVFMACDAHQYMGICSLSALKDSTEMWNNYAQNASGYCVEFDLREYEENKVLFPVIYENNRKINVIDNVIDSFIGEMIFGISNGFEQIDQSQFIRMFLTKDTLWSYQKEWRLLGDANQRIKAPTIHAIYLGKNTSFENKQKMKEYCLSHNIPLNRRDK